MQELTHFGEYNVGHAHSAVYGAFSIWIMAAFYFIVPRISGRRIWSYKLSGWHFWLQVVGFAVMFTALSISGLQQGFMQQEGVYWMGTVIPIRPYWVMRTFGGTLMDIGLALFAWNMVMTFLIGPKVEEDELSASESATATVGG